MLQRQPKHGMEHWTRSIEAQMETQRGQLRAGSPQQIAANSGAHWEQAGPDNGTMTLTFLQARLVVQVPQYTVTAPEAGTVSTMTQALLMAYLVTADGTPRAGEWIAFRELPDGQFYHQAFSGYTGGRLTRTIGSDLDAFKRGATAAGGGTLSGFGDAAYEFQVLPRLWTAVVYWLGDEEDHLPPQAHVLFDRTAAHYLIIDGLAIVGSQLTSLIVSRAKR